MIYQNHQGLRCKEVTQTTHGNVTQGNGTMQSNFHLGTEEVTAFAKAVSFQNSQAKFNQSEL